MASSARKEPGELQAAPRPAPRPARKAIWRDGRLRRSLQHNAGLRVISVLLALGLWIFVNAGQHGALESFNVPVAYRNLPPHMLITSPRPPQSIKIEVSGPRTLLSLIDPSRLTLRLDLSGAAVGQMSLRVNPEAFNVPRQTTVVGVTPSQIVLDLDEITTRDLPVRLSFTGAVADGYRVTATELNPRTASVRGPSRQLARLDDVASEPIVLSGATANVARMIVLTPPFTNARLDPPEVMANVVVSPIVEEKDFRGMPIQVRGTTSPYRLDPAHVNLTVRGPALTLARLDLHEAVFVDADGMAAGSYDANVQVTLPDGVALVHQSALRVKLKVYRAKRTARP